MAQHIDDAGTFYRADIEGLRGVAVLLVVAYHARLYGFSGGYVGVDVFFVLSGYLITRLLMRELTLTGRLDLIRFYSRRAKRLLPAAALVVVMTSLASYVIFSPMRQREIATSALAATAYASNLWFAIDATNYFGHRPEDSPLLHMWSLSVEEQFYFVWPVFMLVAFAWKRRGTLMISIVAIASFLFCVWLTRARQPYAFFLAPTRAWEFCAGALTSKLSARKPPWLGWAGIAAILSASVMFDRTTTFPGSAAALPVLGTVAVLHSELNALRLSVLQQLGRLSYSWYLWHWPVLVLAGAVSPLSPAGRIACVAASLALAELSYRLVEHPIRQHPALARRPKLAIGLAAVSTLMVASFTLSWRAFARAESLSGVQARLSAAREDRPPLGGCMADLFSSDANPCSFGKPDAGVTVVLFGDSHAAHWYPALRKIARVKGWRLVTFLKSACPPADVDFVAPAIRRRYVECETWRARSLRAISSLRPNAVVVAGSQWYVRSKAVTGDAWREGERRTFRALEGSGHVIHILDTPSPDFDIPECLAAVAWRGHWFTRSCSFQRAAALDARVSDLEHAAAAGFPYVTLVDVNPYICPSARCEPERGGIVLYQDSDHLTASFALSLSPYLEEAIESVLAMDNVQVEVGP